MGIPHQLSNLISVVMLAGWLTSGCRMALSLPAPSAPAPVLLTMPTIERTPGATRAEVPETGTALPGEWVTFVDAENGLRLNHPPQWIVFDPTSAKLETLLDAVEADAVEELATVVRMMTASAENLSIFVALGFLADEPHAQQPGYVDNLTAVILPAQRLSLEHYAVLASKQLDQLPYVDIQQSEVVAGLRPHGLEVVSLRYAIDGALYGMAGEQLQGWQVVLLDESGERLLALTFHTLASDFERLESEFSQIIQRVDF